MTDIASPLKFTKTRNANAADRRSPIRHGFGSCLNTLCCLTRFDRLVDLFFHNARVGRPLGFERIHDLEHLTVHRALFFSDSISSQVALVEFLTCACQLKAEALVGRLTFRKSDELCNAS